jgi:hypothetical protein
MEMVGAIRERREEKGREERRESEEKTRGERERYGC